MKDLVQKVASFVTFDFPLDREYISTKFADTHHYHQENISGWSTNATRQKVIANYWFTNVLAHFAFLLVVPSLCMFLFFPGTELSYLFVVSFAGLVCFPVLMIFHYWPLFYNYFLPQLETIKETYERKQVEQLEKCRQAQLSNFSLALFFYSISKTNHLDPLQCNDHFANLMMKLYGVDAGSLKKNLELILVSARRKNMTERKVTELRNRFSETFSFMEELQFTEGIKKLKELEVHFFNR
jgi:hypothetical protein